MRLMEIKPGARVAVAGAGAFGSTIALVLAEAGFAVHHFDPARLGDNASGVAAGMLAPAAEAVFDPAAAVHLDLLRRAKDLWPALAARIGVCLHREGLRVEGRADWLDEVAARFQALGLTFTRDAGGLTSDEDWRLDARSTLAALRTAALGNGASIHDRALEAGDIPQFAMTVIATGAAGGDLAPELAFLSPIKGQILRAAGGLSEGPILRGPGVYVCPARDPAIGATMEAGRGDLEVDWRALEPLKAAALALRPDLGLPMTAEVGIRATTPDGLPLVGPSQAPGVVLAVGARRNGWLLAPLVADLVAAYLTGKDPGPDAARFEARRFSRPDDTK